MASLTPVLFPWITPEEGRTVAIKWQQVSARYEIVTPILEDVVLEKLLPHCLAIKSKIKTTVAIAAHTGPSYFRVFPRTISPVLKQDWTQLLQDHLQPETEAGFSAALRQLILDHCTAEDQHKLSQQLSSPKKPISLHVQSFFYHLRELNQYMSWMPGTEPLLTQDQLRQAFYDAMPTTWKDRFQSAGHSVTTLTMAQVVRYFRQQEKNSMLRQLKNNRKQRLNGYRRTCTPCDNDNH